MNETREAAIALLETIMRRAKVYEAADRAISKAVAETTAEYTHGLHCIDSEIHEVACKLIDAAIGAPNSDLSAYFLLECIGRYGHGGGITCCGKTWKLRNISDFKAYIDHFDTCQAKAA